jgi:glucose/arabinose dehydrogenase
VRRFLWTGLAACALLGLASRASALPQGFVVEPVLTGLAYPMNLAFSPDGRVFFAELRSGRVRVIKDGRLLSTPFASLSVYSNGERGLLGLALPPGFPDQAPWVYVYYTARVAQPEPHPENRIARIPALGDVGGAVEPLLALPTNAQNAVHNGGELAFGPDGKLYATVGDAFQAQNAPSLEFLGGKVLRLELDGTGAAGNLFSGNPTRSRIWSRGHRNHIGLAFHPLSGGLYQTENGPTSGDEINHIVAGANYGWPECIGACAPPEASLTDPLLAYGSPAIAPTGAGFLRPGRVRTEFAGDLVFGAFNDGRLHRIDFDPATPDRILGVDDRFLDTESLLAEEDDPAEHRLAPLDVTAGPDGHLWFTVADFFDPDSPYPGIYRLRDTTLPPAGVPVRLVLLLVPTAVAALWPGRRRCGPLAKRP